MSVVSDVTPDTRLWGAQTSRAVANVGRIAGPVASDLVHAVVAIKVEAAAG
jgi:fumarate hydratase class II